MRKRLIPFLILPLLTLSGWAFADIKSALEAAIAAEIRSADEKARDDNRKPLETLTFFRLREDMRVLEL
ncbi:MAG: hypothetical protein KDI31_09985, partial [Pseudomonadales bacterium]|nr:hypothetical protein [Pseudomonadales bacterium]